MGGGGKSFNHRLAEKKVDKGFEKVLASLFHDNSLQGITVVAIASHALQTFVDNTTPDWKSGLYLKVDGENLLSDRPKWEFASTILNKPPRTFLTIEKVGISDNLRMLGNLNEVAKATLDRFTEANEELISDYAWITYSTYAWFVDRCYSAVDVLPGEDHSYFEVTWSVDGELIKVTFDHRTLQEDDANLKAVGIEVKER